MSGLRSLSPANDTRDQIRRSALWAAYGDALGFITELTDEAGVLRRAGVPKVEKTKAWKRRVGGRYGLSVELPAGCISDDTQLRLATSRAIGAGGEFDVESFSKIELTVWPSYALGAGRGSQEAAAHLRRRDVTWATNFFSANRADYLKGGGNGAAMRVQPHVWAYQRGAKDPSRLITQVVTNAVATHGHLRGILGAVFHARCLQYALDHHEVPGPEEWDEIASELQLVGALSRDDELLGELWLGQWEMESGKQLADEAKAVSKEVVSDLRLLRALDLAGGEESYAKAVELLDASRLEQRGSGTKTAILAAFLSKLFADDPNQAVVVGANTLATDTDTIATMAGAIVGATASSEPDGPLVDRNYILHEANRMWAISCGAKPATFCYPSLVSWTGPKSALDSVGDQGDGPSIAGLGPATADDRKYETSGKNPAVWQWLELWYGQRVLMKRRLHPKALPSSQRVERNPQYVDGPALADGRKSSSPSRLRSQPVQQGSFEQLTAEELLPHVELEIEDNLTRSTPEAPVTLHELTKQVIDSGFQAQVIGRALLEISDREDGIELSVAFASIIAKARMTRREREHLRPVRKY